MGTPLLDRINDSSRCRRCDAMLLDEQQAIDHMATYHFINGHRPRWLDRLENKDMTSAIYSDGANR